MAEVQVKLLRCQQCSAALHPRAGQPLLACAFCGSSYLVEGLTPAGADAPLRWLPFSLQSAAARDAFDRWLAGGLLRPGDLTRAAVVHVPVPVLVPLYLGGARAHSNWTAEVVRRRFKKVNEVLPPGIEVKTGDGVRMRSDSHFLGGGHDAEYANVFVLASRGISETGFAQMANYDWDRLEPLPATVDVPREEPTLAAGEAMRQVRHRLEDIERAACRAMVPGGEVVDLRVNTVIQDLRVDLAYVPVWVISFVYGGRTYRALVNGATGKTGGEAPLSVSRTALAVVAGLALPAAVAWWLWRRRRS